MRRADTSKPAVSKICDPMWLCRPSRRSASGLSRIRRAASKACPPERDSPNFWSSCAVAMNSCVWASTPTVTRTRTGRDDTELGRDRGDALDLVEGVDDDAAHAVVEGVADLGDALVVAVQADPVAGDAGALGHGELAAGAHVEVQALVMDPPRDLGAEEGLARVEDVGATRQAVEHLGIRLLELPCARTEVVLVDDVCRCAELARQLGDADPADREDAVAPPPHGRRPEGRDEGVDVDRGLEPRGAAIALRVQRSCFVCAHGYILSGAAAPRRVSPLRKTIRTASASSSRAPWIGGGVDTRRKGSHRVVPGVGERGEVGHGATLLDLVADMPLEALREIGEGDEELALADVGQLGEASRGAAVHPCGLGVADDPAQAGVRELGPADGVVRVPAARGPRRSRGAAHRRRGRSGPGPRSRAGRSRSGPSPPG